MERWHHHEVNDETRNGDFMYTDLLYDTAVRTEPNMQRTRGSLQPAIKRLSDVIPPSTIIQASKLELESCPAWQ